MKKIVLSSLYCFLILTVSLDAQFIGSDADLIAFYPFDGNARNMIEDANHGIEANIQYPDNGNTSLTIILLPAKLILILIHS